MQHLVGMVDIGGNVAQMPDDEKNQQNSSDGEEKGSRLDAAKAFFRAMYAGEEPQSESGQQTAAAADSRRVKELEQQAKELEQKVSDAENLYRRMAADFDNFRRRMEREREEFTNAGVRKAAEAIIPALDDLDRAILYLSADSPAEKVIESFQLVASRIVQCLEQAGLKRLNTKGAVFDPRFHEPVQQIETTEQADGTVIHELRGGYTIGDRVIRPALVNVALNPSLTIEPVAELKDEGVPDQEREAQTSSVATATEPKTGEPEAGTQIYDLGNLDDLL